VHPTTQSASPTTKRPGHLIKQPYLAELQKVINKKSCTTGHAETVIVHGRPLSISIRPIKSHFIVPPRLDVAATGTKLIPRLRDQPYDSKCIDTQSIELRFAGLARRQNSSSREFRARDLC
jgi:hypothetical protein